jgi:hypothetical protein
VSPLPAPKRQRAAPGVMADTPSARSSAAEVSTPFADQQATGDALPAGVPSHTLTPTPQPEPVNKALQLARTKIAESITGEMMTELCRTTTISDPNEPLAFQQHEYQILSVLHSALLQVLATARSAPQQHLENQSTAAAEEGGGSTAAAEEGGGANGGDGARGDGATQVEGSDEGAQSRARDGAGLSSSAAVQSEGGIGAAEGVTS